MITRGQLETWLEIALRFVNLPSDHTESDAADEFECIHSTDHGSWDGPVKTYSALRREWVGLLRQIAWDPPLEPELRRDRESQSEPEKMRLRNRLLDMSMDSGGKDCFLLQHQNYAPFVFDDAGRPQIGYMHACRPEGILSVVGMELISPDAEFEIVICQAPLKEPPHNRHGFYFSRPKTSLLRERKQPPIYCAHCREDRVRLRNLVFRNKPKTYSKRASKHK